MRTCSALPNGLSNGKDPAAMESEIETLKAELEETKRKMEAEVAKAREEAFGVMRATGQLDCSLLLHVNACNAGMSTIHNGHCLWSTWLCCMFGEQMLLISTVR